MQSILAVNVTVSAMNVLPAGRLFFCFSHGDAGMAAPEEACGSRAVNDVVVTLFECCVVN